jgi:ribose transport system ATP-binding protein
MNHQRQPVLEARRIDKRFPGVHALQSVDFDLYEGEVHFLLGENGAGKSTLMKILSGSVPEDGGQILLRGRAVRIRDPYHARQLGIGMVYQEFSLIPALSVAENIFMGRWPLNPAGLVDWDVLYRRANDLLSQLGTQRIDPRTPVRRLGTGEQQLVEIAKALSTEPSVLLLDEPASALSTEERANLFRVLRTLRERGVGIIYISHRLADVPEIADRVTVMRDGKKVRTLPVEEASEDLLIRLMVGREISEQFPKEHVDIGPPLLEVRGLSRKDAFHDISFTVRAGEIVGMFGLIGAGRTEVARALFGLDPYDSGQIWIEGRQAHIYCPEDAIRSGVAYLTEDRRQALLRYMTIPPNITLASIHRVTSAGLLRHSVEEQVARHYVHSLRIQPPDLRRKVQFLSGGNQQKVLLARWLYTRSTVLILDEPTQGIDVGAKAEVFRLMCRLAGEGAGILFISSELPEVMAMSDRILVMADGRIVAEYPAASATAEDIMRSAAGGIAADGNARTDH